MAFEIKEEVVLATDCQSFTVEDTTGTYNATTNPTGYTAPNGDPTDASDAVIEVTKFGTTTTYSVTAYPTFPTTTAGTLVTISNTDLGLSATDTIPDGVYLIEYIVTFQYVISATAANSGAGTGTITIPGLDASGVFIAGVSLTILTGLPAGTYTVVSSTYSGGNTIITVAEAIVTTGSIGLNLTIEEKASEYHVFFCQGTSCLNDILKQIDIGECPDCMDTKIDLAAKFKTLLLAAQYAAACGKPNKATVILNYLSELCDLTSCDSCD